MEKTQAEAQIEIQTEKTPQKTKFEAEVSSIKRQYGDIEAIRNRLGLSRREICEELMVDPSAWTRWTQKEASIPPHVYKTLAFLSVKFQNQRPVFAERGPCLESFRDDSKTNLNFSHIEALRASVYKIENQMQNREVLSVGWKLLLIVNFVLILYVLIQ